jgi:hypothetical protein
MFKEIIVVYYKHKNTLSEQNADFINVQAGGTYSNHCAL